MTGPEAYEGDGIRVRFDHGNPAKVMDLATAQLMLMDWRARSPAQFGYWFAAALTGTEPAKTNRKAKPAGE